jgi:hypothetical protein
MRTKLSKQQVLAQIKKAKQASSSDTLNDQYEDDLKPELQYEDDLKPDKLQQDSDKQQDVKPDLKNVTEDLALSTDDLGSLFDSSDTMLVRALDKPIWSLLVLSSLGSLLWTVLLVFFPVWLSLALIYPIGTCSYQRTLTSALRSLYLRISNLLNKLI